MARTQALLWPDLYNGQVIISPPRNGMNRLTGGLLQGWEHVEQSLEFIFTTPFRSRVLRRWVGSFVPPLLGRNINTPTIFRFYWAIISAIDLWEPDYRITSISFMTNIPNINMTNTEAVAFIRAGHAFFSQKGVYYPRGHLGNFTPAQPPANLYRPLSALQINQLQQMST